MQTTVNLMD